nr:MAG TPA: hypothetical protein [Caudoviricetes sp.]
MEPIENIEELRNAYEETVARAAKEGKADFMCGAVLCDECPFKMFVGHCTDETVDGAGRKRTVEEWQQWWHELTGETVEEGAAPTESTVSAGEDTTVEDNLQPTVPNVDIIWTTAMGAVKHRHGPIALLDGEMRQFSANVGTWISEMSKPDTCNGVADSIMFVARDETGAVLANVELFAELFGKRKVWESLER